MKSLIFMFLILLAGCSRNNLEVLTFDRVSLKINAFPDDDIEFGCFRGDTAFVSIFEHVHHLNRGGSLDPSKNGFRERLGDNDSLVVMDEIPISNRTMGELNQLLNGVDFKSAVLAMGPDGVLDGTMWTLEVMSSWGYSSKLSFRSPLSFKQDGNLERVRVIVEFIVNLHGKKLSDMPK